MRRVSPGGRILAWTSLQVRRTPQSSTRCWLRSVIFVRPGAKTVHVVAASIGGEAAANASIEADTGVREQSFVRGKAAAPRPITSVRAVAMPAPIHATRKARPQSPAPSHTPNVTGRLRFVKRVGVS
jgi:hypothetical protein